MTTYENMRQVTKQEFFATVGQLDVTPEPTGKWDDPVGCVSRWRLRYGGVVGISDGGVHGVEERYFVRA